MSKELHTYTLNRARNVYSNSNQISMNNVKVEFHIEYIKAGDIFQIQFEINGYFCFFSFHFTPKYVWQWLA